MPNIEQLIQDLIAGAAQAGVPVERQLDRGSEEKLASAAGGALSDAYNAGAVAAFETYKVAFVGQLATAMAGPMIRSGVNWAGKRAPGIASGVAKFNKMTSGPVAGMAFDTAASGLASKVLSPSQPQQGAM
jgi:hypothetical protein